MTKWQWSVIIAICKIIIDMKQDYLAISDIDDLNLLHEAVDKEEK